MAVSGIAYCAHIRVSWRTENFEADIEATEAYPGGRHLLTRGWWECDSNCGAKFFPHIPPAADRPVENI